MKDLSATSVAQNRNMATDRAQGQNLGTRPKLGHYVRLQGGENDTSRFGRYQGISLIIAKNDTSRLGGITCRYQKSWYSETKRNFSKYRGTKILINIEDTGIIF